MPPTIHAEENRRRPERLQVVDELGRPRTLDAQLPVRLWKGRPDSSPLILGLGPKPELPAEQFAALYPSAAVKWLECPECEQQMPTAWHVAVPEHWHRLSPIDFRPECETGDVWCYRPGLRLFSDFWGPILSRLQLAQLRAGCPPPSSRRSVLLPGDEQSLLTRELEQAFLAENFMVVRVPPTEPAAGQAVAEFLRHSRPSLFFSVNLRGLDPDGLSFRLLQAAEVPVAVWFVDNPWHIISSLRLPWWRQASLFTCDASFIPSLQAHGAGKIVYLPLAAWFDPRSRLCTQREDLPAHCPLVFVGRSSFPDKSRFFSGCRIPEELLSRSLRSEKGTPPHFNWWTKALNLKEFWPGRDVRIAGLGAEESSLARRTEWLSRAAAIGLTVYGDEGWRSLLPPETVLRPAVDYYTRLPSIYAAAPYNLNITSLLLPAGLTQRHFDVWMAGGFLLSDATPGLELFPSELVTPITLRTPADIAERIAVFERDPAYRKELAAAWVAYITKQHTYRSRIREICERLGL